MRGVVEFIGIPGSGKSSALKALRKSLRQKGGTPVYSLEEAVYQGLKRSHHSGILRHVSQMLPFRFGYRLVGRFPRSLDDIFYLSFKRFLQAYPALSNFALKDYYQNANRSGNIEFLSLLWFFELFAKYQFATEELPLNECVILIDEGFCQRMTTLFGDTEALALHLDDDFISQYLCSIPLPDVLIVLTTSVQQAMHRMKVRGFPIRMQAMSSDEQVRYLTKIETSIKQALECLRQKNITIIELSNEGNESALQSQLQTCISSNMA